MRECFRCGLLDSPCWRHKRHRLLTDYCHISELDVFDKELAEMIRQKKDVIVGHYIYHLTKSFYVDRIHISDSANGKTWHEPDQEKRPRFQPLNQTKLKGL